MEHYDLHQFNTWAKGYITDESRFDDNGFIIMKNNKNYKTTGIISKIFEDHWNTSEFAHIIKYRPNVDKEIDKIINCSNHNLGASVYVCPNDDEVILV